MDFLKRHWATLVLIGALATYVGISMGTNRCPLCVVGSAIGGAIERPSAAESTAAAESRANWEVTSIDGGTIRGEDLKGKVTLIVYWATWCGPCRDEIPVIIALRELYPDSQLAIIGVTTDAPSKNLENFVAKAGMNYTIAYENRSLIETFGSPDYLPTMLVLDKNGSVAKQFIGETPFDSLKTAIEMQLEPSGSLSHG